MMTTTNRRIALLTGASAAALGMSALAATPALAAPHDTFGPGTAAGTDTTGAVVTICTLATNATCFFGIYDTAAGAATANVTSTADGEIFHHDNAGLVDISMINAAGDSAEVGAIASGTTLANAFLQSPVLQTGTGTDVTLNFDNDGILLVDAVAVATGGAATANANADIFVGVWQLASGTTVDLNLTNDGTVTVLASALATATNDANAHASVSWGIIQDIRAATTANANLTNTGLVNVGAVAVATADDAFAEAYAENGLAQYFSGAGIDFGSGTIVNAGTFNMFATATANGGVSATATATVSNASCAHTTRTSRSPTACTSRLVTTDHHSG